MEDDPKEAPPYVKLVSAEGAEVFLARRIALQVETLRAMLEGNFKESEEGVVRFPDMSAAALEKVARYLHYKDRYSNSKARIPEFPIEPEEVRRRRLCWGWAWGVVRDARGCCFLVRRVLIILSSISR